MVLGATPVVGILSLTIDGSVIPPAPSQTPTSRFTAGYFFTPEAIQLQGYCFPRRSRVVIRYTGGYDPIPGSIQEACIEMVARKYRERTRIAEHSRSLGGAETVSYSTVAFSRRDVVTDIQVILDYYRNPVPIPRPILLPPPAPVLELEDTTTVIELEDQTTPIVDESGPTQVSGSVAPPPPPSHTPY